MNKNKKLIQLADNMLRKADQADALQKIGQDNPEQASKIKNILAAFGPIEDNSGSKDSINKFQKVLDLISENIKNSKDYINFPVSEYKEDKKCVFDIKHKTLAITSVNIEDIKHINKIYKKHINIQSILAGK